MISLFWVFLLESCLSALTVHRNSDIPLLDVDLDFVSFSEQYDETQTERAFEADAGYETR